MFKHILNKQGMLFLLSKEMCASEQTFLCQHTCLHITHWRKCSSLKIMRFSFYMQIHTARCSKIHIKSPVFCGSLWCKFNVSIIYCSWVTVFTRMCLHTERQTDWRHPDGIMLCKPWTVPWSMDNNKSHKQKKTELNDSQKVCEEWEQNMKWKKKKLKLQWQWRSTFQIPLTKVVLCDHGELTEAFQCLITSADPSLTHCSTARTTRCGSPQTSRDCTDEAFPKTF